MIKVNIIEVLPDEYFERVQIFPQRKEKSDNLVTDIRRFYKTVKDMSCRKAKELELESSDMGYQYAPRKVVVDIQPKGLQPSIGKNLLPMGKVYIDNRLVASYICSLA